MGEKLPALLDAKGIQAELGVKRATAQRIMRLCKTKVQIGRKVFVYRTDAEAVLKSLEVSEAA